MNTGYESLEEFIEYADEHYEKIAPYHIENNRKVLNHQILVSSTDQILIITDGQLYYVHNCEDYIYVSTVSETCKYKNVKKSYLDVINEDSLIYKVASNPLNNIKVNSSFGYRTDPINSSSAFHSGVDLAANIGDEIYAVNSGKVITASYNEGYGYYIEIESDITTLYAHCNELFVEEGDYVSAGELIASAGATGRVTGPHLHLECRYNGELIDPMKLIKEEN